MQLVAYGAQDIYLTGNPQITFFKTVYRRHTNFSTETIEQTFSGTASPGQSVTVTISRNGDLVHRLYVEVNTSGTGRSPQNFGHSIIDYAELEIGGQTIDKLYGHWMEIWARLSEVNPTRNVGAIRNGEMVPGIDMTMNSCGVVAAQGGHDTQFVRYPLTPFQQLTCAGGVGSGHYSVNVIDGATAGDEKYDAAYNASGTLQASGTYPPNASRSAKGFANASTTKVPKQVKVPLPFWFCRNPGLALPLIALQYHEVKLKLALKSSVFPTAANSNPTTKIWAEYIYLDTDERRRFAQISHEYLIEQVQRYEQVATGTAGAGNQTINSVTLDLNFNHPVKELVIAGGWPSVSDATVGCFGALPGIADNGTTMSLKLNGHDRFSADRDFYYFSRSQIWEHHTGPGNLYEGFEGIAGGVSSGSFTNATTYTSMTQWGPTDGVANTQKRYDSIGVYSFALKPEEHQPSGTCNFSRIDSTRLTLKNLLVGETSGQQSLTVTVYAVNYNVLRIMSGMGGLAYSN